MIAMRNAGNLASVPILPGKSAQFALGALGLVLLFGLGYQISTRRAPAGADQAHGPGARQADGLRRA